MKPRLGGGGVWIRGTGVEGDKYFSQDFTCLTADFILVQVCLKLFQIFSATIWKAHVYGCFSACLKEGSIFLHTIIATIFFLFSLI